MLWYWMMVALRWFVWLFKMPKPEELAKADKNDRCPVCGATDGWMRCVWKVKPGPRSESRPPDVGVFRQHTCNECGGQRFFPPISKIVDTTTVLPSVARNDLEAKQDRWAISVQQQSQTTQ